MAQELLFPETKGKQLHVPYGWVRLKEGKMSSRTGKVILGEQQILDAVPEKSDKEYIIKELKEKGLCPLVDNEKTHVLSRLLGHMFGDGSLTISMKKFKSNCTLHFSNKNVGFFAIMKPYCKFCYR